jgi:LysR family transcriptional regulator, hydrogen peroxide-inducible genes activator
MNLQQLEYIIAVYETRNFARAADRCCVTQPTLSMMIHKLEEELEIKIFDRKSKPVVPTRAGEEIIHKARQIVAEVNHLKEFSKELRGEVTGELRLGIIPTLAPYLLPLFLKSFTANYPELRIFVRELFTEEIINELKKGELDIGLLATPLNDRSITERILFYEEFFVYASESENLPEKKLYLPKEIHLDHLWLLEEGHCLRSQVLNLCALKQSVSIRDNLHYEAGSIETLIHLVDRQEGITIVPRLAIYRMTPGQKKKLREFAEPKPVREISLVFQTDFPRKKLLEILEKEITGILPFERDVKKKSVLEIQNE